MKISKILYFLEPHIELSDPLFRYPTFKSKLLPEIRGLLNYNNDISVTVVLGDHVLKKIRNDDLNVNGIEFVPISKKELDKYSCNYLESSIQWYNENHSKKSIENYVDFLRSKIGVFEPEVTICYESPAPFLNELFPNALNLNTMFGFFSRAPFPAYNIIDPCGIYANSYQSKYSSLIRKYKADAYELETLRILRRQSMKALATYFPFKEFIHNIRVCFDKVVLLAAQIDGYLAFDGCTKHKSQYDMVYDVLTKTPSNIGVLVTQHDLKEQFSESQIESLKNKFPNFILFKNNIGCDNASQFFIPYLDGVLSVSSSVAYQSALWRKPFYCLGESQMNIISCANNIESYYSFLENNCANNLDDILAFLLRYCNFSHKFDIFDGENYYKILSELYCRYTKYSNGFEMLIRDVTKKEVRDKLVGGNREWLLKKNTLDKKIPFSSDYLRLGMSCANAVSYDLFDTLVERDFREPHELFLFIEPMVQDLVSNINFKYCHFRRQAEADTRRPTRGRFEVTIDEIYNTFEDLTGIDNDLVEKIKKLEIQAEIDLVQPKKFMVREYYFSKILCRSVAIISDIYFEKPILEKILKRCGINSYDLLLSSATSKTRKHNGTIYPEYLSWLKEVKGIGEDRAFHVGDNAQADGKMAKQHGLSTYVFPKAMDNYKRSKIAAVLSSSLQNSSCTTSILNGTFANKFYSAHWNYIKKDSVFDGEAYFYGYKAIGPLVLGFVQWLFRRAKQQGISNLYFLARDGWLLKKVYDEFYSDIKDKPTSHYMYCSRRAVILPSMKNVDDIVELACQSFDPRSLESFLLSRYGIESNEIPISIWKKFKYKKNSIVSPLHDQKRFIGFLRESAPYILKKAVNEKESYVDYLDSINFLKSANDGSAAVVDIGYSGSMQFYLKKMLNLGSLPGYYFLTHHHARKRFEGDVFEGFLSSNDDHRSSYRHKLNDHVFIFEAALSSPEGSLINFTGKGEKREMHLLDAEEEVLRVKLLNLIHSGAFDFARDLSIRFNRYRHNIELSSIISEKMIINFADHPSYKDASMFINFEVENLFGGGSVWLIETPSSMGLDKTRRLSNELVQNAIENSKWKKGAKAYYNGILKNNGIVGKTITVVSNKTIDRRDQKKNKLIRDPYLFFNDSKKPYLKPLKYLFSLESPFNSTMTKILRKALG